MGVLCASYHPRQLLRCPFRVLLSALCSILVLLDEGYSILSLGPHQRVRKSRAGGTGRTQTISRLAMSSLVPCSSRPLDRHIVFNTPAPDRSRDDFPILYSMNDLFVLSIFSWS